MAITKSAKKAERVSERKKVFNLRRKRTMRDTMKDVTRAVAGEGTGVNELLSQAYKAIDKAAKQGVIKDNTADRKKSRLARLVARETGKKEVK
ncbi:MAG: 30S ribosomal protein S20 [Candidatus Pacebacteria bacterium]|nr:30S ribosomal protein S20 [Candidatus Paceibacterota bacterium]